MAFAGFDVPLQMDIPAEKMILGVQGIDAARRDRLIKVNPVHTTSTTFSRVIELSCKDVIFLYKEKGSTYL